MVHLKNLDHMSPESEHMPLNVHLIRPGSGDHPLGNELLEGWGGEPQRLKEQAESG